MEPHGDSVVEKQTAKSGNIINQKRHKAQNPKPGHNRIRYDETLHSILGQRTQYRIYFNGERGECQANSLKNYVYFRKKSPTCPNTIDNAPLG